MSSLLTNSHTFRWLRRGLMTSSTLLGSFQPPISGRERQVRGVMEKILPLCDLFHEDGVF